MNKGGATFTSALKRVVLYLAAAVLLVLFRGLEPSVAALVLFAGILVEASLEDLRSMTIPNPLIGAACGAWVAYAFLAGFGPTGMVQALAGSLAVTAGLLVFTLLYEAALKQPGMGGGDIKLLFTCGLFLGVSDTLTCLLLACPLGLACWWILQKTAREQGPSRAFPFAPAVCLSCFVMLCFPSAGHIW